MKKKLPKGKTRCVACKKILSDKELYKHLKSEEHLRNAIKIKEVYERSLDRLINQDK